MKEACNDAASMGKALQTKGTKEGKTRPGKATEACGGVRGMKRRVTWETERNKIIDSN